MGNIDVCGGRGALKRSTRTVSTSENSKPPPSPPLMVELVEVTSPKAETLSRARETFQLISATVCPLLATKKTLTIDQLDRLMTDLREADWYLAMAGCLMDPELGLKGAFQVAECFHFVATNLISRVLNQREPDSRWATDLVPLFGGWSLRQTAKNSLASLQEIGKIKSSRENSFRQMMPANGSSLRKLALQTHKPEVDLQAGIFGSKRSLFCPGFAGSLTRSDPCP